jgi:hypothetical protein
MVAHDWCGSLQVEISPIVEHPESWNVYLADIAFVISRAVAEYNDMSQAEAFAFNRRDQQPIIGSRAESSDEGARDEWLNSRLAMGRETISAGFYDPRKRGVGENGFASLSPSPTGLDSHSLNSCNRSEAQTLEGSHVALG